MKITSCILYTLFTILYLRFADTDRFTGGMYMINQFSYIAILCYFVVSNRKNTKIELSYLKHSILVALTLFIYTLSCIWADPKWILLFTPYICSFMVTTFILMNGYILLNKNEYN